MSENVQWQSDIVADTELWWQEAGVRQKEVEIQKPKGRKDFGKI